MCSQASNVPSLDNAPFTHQFAQISGLPNIDRASTSIADPEPDGTDDLQVGGLIIGCAQARASILTSAEAVPNDNAGHLEGTRHRSHF
jgi:hypothetical protein